MTRADWRIVKVTDLITFIEDLDSGRMSVTNDAEAVFEAVQRLHPNKRVVYKDSNGQWDEIYMVGSMAQFSSYIGREYE